MKYSTKLSAPVAVRGQASVFPDVNCADIIDGLYLTFSASNPVGG
ncbi:UNVERIFIED_ORG: hypothetical protein GGI63_006112 [Rhizobium esperanzae]